MEVEYLLKHEGHVESTFFKILILSQRLVVAVDWVLDNREYLIPNPRSIMTWSILEQRLLSLQGNTFVLLMVDGVHDNVTVLVELGNFPVQAQTLLNFFSLGFVSQTLGMIVLRVLWVNRDGSIEVGPCVVVPSCS